LEKVVMYLVVSLALSGCTGEKSDLVLPSDDTASSADTDTDTDSDTDADSDTDTDTDSDSDTDTDTDADTDTDTAGSAGVEHCGTIEADEVWSAADSPHHVTCDLKVEGATITVEAGAQVVVDRYRSIQIGAENRDGGLIVAGTSSSPVTFGMPADDADAHWSGLQASRYVTSLSLSHVTFSNGGHGTHGALYIEAVTGLYDHVSVLNSENDGIELTDGAAFAPGSAAVTVNGAAGYALDIDAAGIETIPADFDASGNVEVGVYSTGGTVDHAATWPDLGVPYVIGADVLLEGEASSPAVLTLPAGMRLEFELGKGMLLSQYGGASGLLAQGTEADPVVFTAHGASTPGYWRGISALEGVDDTSFQLDHTRIEYAGNGGQDSALYSDAPLLHLRDVEIIGSSANGLALAYSAELSTDSSNVSITGCDVPAEVHASGIGSM
jgi:hypothetical protein